MINIIRELWNILYTGDSFISLTSGPNKHSHGSKKTKTSKKPKLPQKPKLPKNQNFQKTKTLKNQNFKKPKLQDVKNETRHIVQCTVTLKYTTKW